MDNFMQSENWAKVKKNWSYEIIETENAHALVLIKKIPILNTSFLYCPRGPICDFHSIDSLREIFEKIHITAKKYNAFSLKIDPFIDENDYEAIENLCKLKFIHRGEKAGYDNIQCKENYLLNLDKSEEEIFASFSKKHRYNIRLADRKGVICKKCGKEKLDEFYSLMKETAIRDGFNIRKKEYYERLLDSFKEEAGLFLCYHEGKLLSGALYVLYNGVLTYLYGCSSSEKREVMPCYKMQYELIKYAISSNAKYYDFGGIPYYYDKEHQNYGVYRFKKGFSGKIVTYAGEFDYVYKKWVIKLFYPLLKKKKCI